MVVAETVTVRDKLIFQNFVLFFFFYVDVKSMQITHYIID